MLLSSYSPVPVFASELMTDQIDINVRLREGSDDEIKALLYQLGRSDALLPSVDLETICSLLIKKDSELRERALFVFGIKGKRKDALDCIAETMIAADTSDWDVVAAGVLALLICDCKNADAILINKLISLFNDDTVVRTIGWTLYSYILLANEKIDKAEVYQLSRPYEPFDRSLLSDITLTKRE